jgi:hypothetical protein
MSEHIVKIILIGQGVEIDRDPAEARVTEGPDYGNPSPFLRESMEKVAGKVRADVAERLRNYPPGTTLKETEGEKSCVTKEKAVPILRNMEVLEKELEVARDQLSRLENQLERFLSPASENGCGTMGETTSCQSPFAESINKAIWQVRGISSRLVEINERLEV